MVDVDGRFEAFLFEVPGDRERSGVEAVGGQLLADLDDTLTDRLGSGGGFDLRAP